MKQLSPVEEEHEEEIPQESQVSARSKQKTPKSQSSRKTPAKGKSPSAKKSASKSSKKQMYSLEEVQEKEVDEEEKYQPEEVHALAKEAIGLSPKKQRPKSPEILQPSSQSKGVKDIEQVIEAVSADIQPVSQQAEVK